MPRILVTGGCGYIGSHTLIDLVENGYEAVSIDNLLRSNGSLLGGVERITGRRIQNHKIDLCDAAALRSFFENDRAFDGIIHFAALKAVGESVEQPLLYYRNNLASHLNLLDCVERYNIPSFVFSSSCSVYGNVETLPVTENTPRQEAASPYANTKRIGEDMLFDLAPRSKNRFVALRYFNPVGAHPSGLVGEEPQGTPNNLVPVITQTAAGILPQITVHGTDYPTRDGTCIRDYIHVMDIARAHRLAFENMNKMQNGKVEVINLGSGNGVSVKEMIDAFEKTTSQKLNYSNGPRRAGDVVQIYADNSKAKRLIGWQPEYDVNDMMRTAWQWEMNRGKSVAAAR